MDDHHKIKNGGKMKKFFALTTIIFFAVLSTSLFAQSQVESGKFSANTSSPNYTLDKNSGDRSYTIEVTFPKPFDTKPNVVLAVSQLDASTSTNIRYNVEAVSVSRDNFTVKITTWSDSKILGISGTWLAHTE